MVQAVGLEEAEQTRFSLFLRKQKSDGKGEALNKRDGRSEILGRARMKVTSRLLT